jgi:hypothetical protein
MVDQGSQQAEWNPVMQYVAHFNPAFHFPEMMFMVPDMVRTPPLFVDKK